MVLPPTVLPTVLISALRLRPPTTPILVSNNLTTPPKHSIRAITERVTDIFPLIACLWCQVAAEVLS